MSVSCYFLIEVKGVDGKWHLVKWYSNEPFEEFDKDTAIYSFETEAEINGKKTIEKHEIWTGLQWRDELSWSRNFERDISTEGLPKDISEELDALIKKRWEKEKERRVELYGSPESEYEYKTRFCYTYLNEMWGVCDERMKQWRDSLLKCVRDTQLDEINDKLDDLKKLVQGKEVKAKKKKDDDEEFYEDTLEYHLDEHLENVIALRKETKMLSTIAETFVGDSWLDAENVRVYFYFS